MKALLLIAHGSRREASNDEVRQLAERIRQLGPDAFDFVVPAFLEIAEPSIGGGIDRCVELGAEQVTVLPYFLCAGRHVAEDIPTELKVAQGRHPRLKLTLRPHIGAAELMAAMVLDAACGLTPASKTATEETHTSRRSPMQTTTLASAECYVSWQAGDSSSTGPPQPETGESHGTRN